MNKFKILCTADLHLGRSSAVALPLNSVDTSVAGAWRRIVDTALIEAADAVVIAGDIFDGTGPFVEVRRSFTDGLKLLQTKGIPVIAVAGNHDWNVLPLFAREAPANFHLLGRSGEWEAKTIPTKSGDLNFFGWSFAAEHVTESQFLFLNPQASELPVVGIVHGDSSPRSPYHPITESDFIGKADAWIVGHVHRSGAFGPSGIYPGSPQALDFGPGERGIHGVRWLEIEKGRAAFSEIVPISSVRFECVEITLDVSAGQDPIETALDALQERCLKICQESTTLESVQLRADVCLLGAESAPKWEDLRLHSYLESHSITFTNFRSKKVLDPWFFKDLRSSVGEAARLLIGARAIGTESANEDEEAVPEKWVDEARKLVEQTSRDIELNYQRSLATVSDRGESGIEPPSTEDRFVKARKLLIEELETVLQGVSN